jgi:hypothetical protein
VAERVERDFRSGIAAGVMRTPALFWLSDEGAGASNSST